MKAAILELSRELNRDLVDEVKTLKIELETANANQERSIKQTIKELNKERINALGLKLIRGGKYAE